MTNLEKIEGDLNKLVDKGISLQMGMLKDLNWLNKVPENDPVLKTHSPINFSRNYEIWYSESLHVIKQLIPDRLDDFKSFYKNTKRQKLEYTNYTVSDYLINVVRTIGDEIIVNREAAYLKYQQQLDILRSAQRKFKSSLFEIKQIVQANLWDSEIDAAKELHKKGYYRAAGTICGVILEKQLQQVCENHNVIIQKKNLTIADLNDQLKNNNIIEVSDWRFIQHLADLRNKCGHNKDQEPSKVEVNDLINGTDKIIKTIY